MPKPSRAAPSRDQHGHEIVRLPAGGEIIPEHFNEGRQAAQHFSRTLGGVLAAPHAVAAKTHQDMKQRAARAKQRRKAS